jgi:hypothetical protein
MSSKIGSLSFLNVPTTTKKFLEQITSKKLHEIFKIDDSVLCDEIKRYEADFKEMFAETKETLEVFKKVEDANKIEQQLGQKKARLRSSLVWAPICIIGGASLIYGRLYSKPIVAGVGCLISFVAAYAINVLLPKASSNLTELPDLKLQARKIKDHIQLKLTFLATDLEKLETQSREIAIKDINNEQSQKIQATRDQLITAQTYFKTVTAHRSFV